MPKSLIPQHHEFFQDNGYLEITQLLSEERVMHLSEAVLSVVCDRLDMPPMALAQVAPEKIYDAGRDVWRGSAEIRDIVRSKTLGRLIGALLHADKLRLAYDQVLGSGKTEPLTKSRHLEFFSSVQGLVGGLILCLEGNGEGSGDTLWPTTPGNGVFVKSRTSIPFEALSEFEGCRYLLIAYSVPKSIYVRNENDPHTNDLKTLGYSFGDSLKENTHPIVI